ncbi:MAG: 23S rRNA (pseudouridine(1915)-N(3))-methyltransferase RlmH [Alphaproteobacteria bacterium CG11_big_fil_rev_8_21_14_0_20_39_49]|nr:MAG: 23S rRNA (pseudouridine(1915)-N(3))-methyltransferase RlmH [Alphaproteobacteria bacterium CG11_big_fil_rev_8_21_14_0_20_39_49]
MKVLIAAIGKDKRSSATFQLFEEYKKRIKWNVELKEFEHKKNLPPEILKEKEASLLLQSVEPSAKIIVLDENGKNLSSEEFASLIKTWQDEGSSNLAFLIGGAAGHGKEVLEKADFKLSFGKLTWPHMMVRAMLSEQLYRASSIIAGHPYHRS